MKIRPATTEGLNTRIVIIECIARKLRAPAIVAMLLATLPPTLVPAAPVWAATFLERAQQYAEEGDLGAAEVELKNALQRDPDSADARFLLGKVHLLQGNSLSAVKELERARSLGYLGEELDLLMARARILGGSYREVIESIDPDIEFDTTIARSLFVARGEALLHLGREDEAAAIFEAALAKGPMTRATGGLARIALTRGQIDEAGVLLEQALTEEPDNVEWLVLKGEWLLLQDRFDEAKVVFERSLEAGNTDLGAHLGFIRSLFLAGDRGEAKGKLDELLANNPNNPNLVLVSSLLNFELGNYQEAKTAADRILGMDPQNRRALFVSGGGAFHLRQYEAAHARLTQYVQNLQNQTEDPRAYLYLAATKLRLGRHQEAYALLQTVPTEMLETRSALSLMAEAAIQSGSLDAGVQYFERLARESPDNVDLQERLKALRAAVAEKKASVETLQSNLRTGLSQDPELDDVARRVLVLIQQRRLDEASDAVRKLASRYPNRAIGYTLQGVIALERDDIVAASSAFRTAWQVEPTSPSAGLNLAQIERILGNMDQSAQVLKDVVTQYPGNLRALLMLAQIEGERGRPEAQEQRLREAVRSDGTSGGTDARVLLGRFLLQNNRAAEALDATLPAMDTGSKNPALLETIAISQLALAQPTNALDTVEHLAAVSPEAGQTYYLKAKAHIALGNLDEARTALETAITVQPQDVSSRMQLISLLQQRLELTEARRHLDYLREHNGDDPRTWDLDAKALLVDKKFPEAVASLERALELGPATTRASFLARTQWAMGQYSESTTTLENWLASHPDDRGLRELLSSYLLVRGEVDRAVPHLKHLVGEDPEDWKAQNNYAWALWKKGDLQTAHDHAQVAHELTPQSASAKDTLGLILLDMGEIDTSIRLFHEAADLSGGDPSVRLHLAQAFVKKGEKADAKRVLQDILATEDSFRGRAEAEELLQSLGD